MANFSSLKQSIQNYIKENGNKEITGNLLQEILLSMVLLMGDQAINGVSQMLSNEKIARENADGLLNQALTAEQQRAIAAETKSAVLDGETKMLVFKNAAGQELYHVSLAALISNGLVDVEVDGTNLVMTFHTESGNEEITIPIGDIFSPSNYYTKTQVNGLLLPITTAITNVSLRLNAGYIYLGLADPETIPTSATGKFFYIATQKGTYHFMSNGDIPIVISSDGLYILSGGVETDDWFLQTIVTFTNNVQLNNSQPVTSGGVFNAILPINDLLRRNYMLAGVADTTTIPTEDTNVFYLAGQGGTYTHFLNGDEEPLVLPKGLTVIYRGVEDDGWNYWNVYADNDFINTNRAQELSPAQKSLARTNIDVYSKTETYNKTELDSLITTPNQEYVTVVATAQTTAVTDLLPAIGAADTIYRVGCWDGNQYDNTVYSEYAWNGSRYIYLSTKVGDIVDQKYVEKEEYLYILADKLKYLLDTIDKNGNRKIYTPVEMETGAKVNGALKIEKVLFGDILRKQDNSEEWFEKTTDSQGKIIEGIRRDGSKVIANYPEMKDAQRRIVALEATQDPSTISVTVDINGHGDFTSILRAIKYMADNGKKGDIIIKAGDYDVCAEYRDYNGQTYFEDYTGIYYRGGDDMGYYLRPGMNLIGEGTVRLIYNYDGNNEYVHQSFSIINTTCNNIVSNLTLITVTDGKCRYLIHDDYVQDSASMTGTNIFKNIIFKGYTHFGTSMGCGMGIANTYIIEDCYFMQDSSDICISYHNSATSNVAENRLYITGCKGYGKCVVLTIGPSTRITPCVVSNCEFREIVKEMHYMGGEDNMELIKFNNTETGNN